MTKVKVQSIIYAPTLKNELLHYSMPFLKYQYGTKNLGFSLTSCRQWWWTRGNKMLRSSLVWDNHRRPWWGSGLHPPHQLHQSQHQSTKQHNKHVLWFIHNTYKTLKATLVNLLQTANTPQLHSMQWKRAVHKFGPSPPATSASGHELAAHASTVPEMGFLPINTTHR